MLRCSTLRLLHPQLPYSLKLNSPATCDRPTAAYLLCSDCSACSTATLLCFVLRFLRREFVICERVIFLIYPQPNRSVFTTPAAIPNPNRSFLPLSFAASAAPTAAASAAPTTAAAARLLRIR
ncbi:hypothetical protein L1987_86316 [Smallanthus sonchifolius]|uniref:Uncharacterized protein n=1 Tax=Smallanthus sonchifolius TaxID=185202 RepID=A0ACB8XZ30_9ASTR|nr:hypothetical protein L1987_86316 [Smallanthus sonchifolius]